MNANTKTRSGSPKFDENIQRASKKGVMEALISQQLHEIGQPLLAPLLQEPHAANRPLRESVAAAFGVDATSLGDMHVARAARVHGNCISTRDVAVWRSLDGESGVGEVCAHVVIHGIPTTIVAQWEVLDQKGRELRARVRSHLRCVPTSALEESLIYSAGVQEGNIARAWLPHGIRL